MRYVLLILLLWGAFFEAVGQPVARSRVEGQVVSAATGEAVPYATIRLEGLPYGTVSNLEGEFELVFPGDVASDGLHVIARSIGYKALSVPLEDLPEESARLELPEAPYTLDDVVISWSDLTPRQLVVRAFEKIPQNYSLEPYQLKTFYRHYCKEDETYGRIIEAAMTIYEPHGHEKLYGWPGRKAEVRVDQLRRSFDFTYLYPGSHSAIALYKILSNDWTSYRNPLYSKPENFHFTVEDTTWFEGAWVFVIAYEAIEKGPGRPTGRLYLTMDDLAFIQIEMEFNRQFNRKKGLARSETAYLERQITRYRKTGEHYFVNHMVNEGVRKERILDQEGKHLHTVEHEHHVEMMTSSVLTENFKSFSGKEPRRKDLEKVPYKPGFWKTYNVLKATPTEKAIEADLAKRMPLEDQFRTFNAQGGAVILSGTDAFDRMVRQNIGRLTYVQFYDDIALGKLKAARKLARKYDDGRIATFFVYIDRNGKGLPALVRGRDEVLRSGLIILTRPGSRLLQRYGVTKAPHFVLLGIDGNPLDSRAPAPDEKEIEAYINRHLSLHSE